MRCAICTFSLPLFVWLHYLGSILSLFASSRPFLLSKIAECTQVYRLNSFFSFSKAHDCQILSFFSSTFDLSCLLYCPPPDNIPEDNPTPNLGPAQAPINSVDVACEGTGGLKQVIWYSGAEKVAIVGCCDGFVRWAHVAWKGSWRRRLSSSVAR